jgi:hypothetical protein
VSTAFRRTARKNVQSGKGAHKAVFRLLVDAVNLGE